VVSGRRKVYYGWWLLAGSVLAMALGSGVSFWAFGLYVRPLEDDFGWSRAEVSLGFSASLLASGLAGPFVGRWIDTRGARSAILVGAALTSLTYVLLAYTRELWQWYLFLSLNAVCRQLMFFIPFQSLISRWFERRRGVALSILGTGFSLGGFAVVPLLQAVMDRVDWDGSFIVSAIAIAAVFLPIGLLLVRNSPAELGLEVDGAPALEAGQRRPPTRGATLQEAIRTPLFWVLSLALMLFFFGMFGWMVHTLPFYESVGISRGTAAAMVSAAAAAGIAVRLSFGAAADRIHRIELAVMGLAAAMIVAMGSLLISSGSAGIAVFMVFWILGTGGGPMIEALLLTRAFGIQHFATILGAVVVVETVGQIASPTVAGAIYDATGSYDLALIIFVATFAGSFALFGLALRLPRPDFASGRA
jgi:sugar phosphate permease